MGYLKPKMDIPCISYWVKWVKIHENPPKEPSARALKFHLALIFLVLVQNMWPRDLINVGKVEQFLHLAPGLVREASKHSPLGTSTN